MSSFEKKHKKGGSKLGGGGGEKVIYILSVFSGEKSEIAKRTRRISIHCHQLKVPSISIKSWRVMTVVVLYAVPIVTLSSLMIGV